MGTAKLLLIALLTATCLVPTPAAKNKGEQAPKGNDTKSETPEENKPTEPAVIQNQPHTRIESVNAISTVVIAIFAVVTAVAIFFQIKTARNTDRAWIIVLPMLEFPPIGYIPEVGDTLFYPGRDAKNVFFASAKNTGNTPARITEFRVKYKQVASLEGIPKNPDYGPRPKSPDEILLCKEEEPVAAFAFLEPNIIITKPEKEKIERQESFLYAYGIVVYKDAFHRKHETKFGFIYHMPIGGDAMERGFRREKMPSAYNRAS
jgi:hypothetical protein